MLKINNTVFIFIILLFLVSCTYRVENSAYMIKNSQVEILTAPAGDYKITTYWPNQSTPKEGWPIIYLLDGDTFFAPAVAMLEMQNCQRCALQQSVIVAIDYPKENHRDRDYLPKPPTLIPEILPNGTANVPEQYGGADEFLQFIENQLKPLMAQRFLINPHQQILFGHSYGGLLVLHTLFTQPQLFNYYIASSPSIWFSERYILKELSAFIQERSRQPLSRPTHLMLSVGGKEQSLSQNETSASNIDQQLRLKHKQNRRMIDNSRELAQLLKHASLTNLRVDYQIYPKQTHFTAPMIALQDGIQTILTK